MTGMVEEEKMPEGWNPSDDSEDEYTPAATRDAAKKRAGDNDSGEKLCVKKAKVNQPGTEGTASSIPLPPVKVTREKDVNARFNLTFILGLDQVKPEKDAAEKCVICSKELLGAGGNTNMRWLIHSH